MPNFYDELEGNDIGEGRALNPFTSAPYETQMVPRGDYTRVLAEFWADGPDSETPPGHWFTILNYVSDNPVLIKRFKGEGPVLSDLEWDVKSYLILAWRLNRCYTVLIGGRSSPTVGQVDDSTRYGRAISCHCNF